MPKLNETKVYQILDYLEGHTKELSTDMEEYYNLLREIYRMRLANKSKAHIEKVILREYPEMNKLLVNRRMTEMEELFGNIGQTDRRIAQQVAIHNATRALELANKLKDPLKIAKATEVYIKACGLDKEKNEIPLEKLQAAPVIAALPEGAMEILSQLLAGGAVNLNSPPELPAENTIDISHEEV